MAPRSECTVPGMRVRLLAARHLLRLGFSRALSRAEFRIRVRLIGRRRRRGARALRRVGVAVAARAQQPAATRRVIVLMSTGEDDPQGATGLAGNWTGLLRLMRCYRVASLLYAAIARLRSSVSTQGIRQMSSSVASCCSALASRLISVKDESNSRKRKKSSATIAADGT